METDEQLNEPTAEYSISHTKTITFFNSMQEMEEHGLKLMALQSPEERLVNLEKLRKRIFHHLLLPDQTYPKIKRIITKTLLPYAVG